MTRLLMVVSSATEMTLANGHPHVTGYWPEEVFKPYRRFRDAGVDVVVATPDGRTPQPDPYGLEQYFHYPTDDQDFMASVIRTFADDADDIRMTLHHLTELNLIASRRIFHALVAAGADPQGARRAVESAARTAWRQDRDLVDVLAEDAEVSGRVPRQRLAAIADDVQQDSVAKARAMADGLAAIPELNNPLNLSALGDEEIRSFDAVFFPGGHGPMVDLNENPDVARVLRILHEQDKTISALCHGPAALLSAPETATGWLFDGYKMVAFTDEEEDQTPAGKLGMSWYLETELKNRGAVFDDADAAWTSHVIVDRNLITAQNPASSEAAADAVLKRLGVL